MAQLVLLVVAAAWLAVLIPPMLRSRVENRPNSSVTDFRRQLTKLQNTATPPRGSARAMGRPLAQSPLHRPAANGRPNQPVMRSGLTRHPNRSDVAARQAVPATAPQGPGRQYADPTGDQPRLRQHGDPTGGQPRPRQHGDATNGHRRPPARTGSVAQGLAQSPTSDAKRRRSNVLFVLVVTTACTLFLAATTSSTVMLYLFALSFLGLCGYVYLLAQLRDRGGDGYDGWLEQY